MSGLICLPTTAISRLMSIIDLLRAKVTFPLCYSRLIDASFFRKKSFSTVRQTFQTILFCVSYLPLRNRRGGRRGERGGLGVLIQGNGEKGTALNASDNSCSVTWSSSPRPGHAASTRKTNMSNLAFIPHPEDEERTSTAALHSAAPSVKQ